MKYRTTGILSLILAAMASLAVYNTGSTNAQPPLGSASRDSQSHDHAHDHNAHDGHDHSHQPTGESPQSGTTAVPAPSGGPPPLPGERSTPTTSPNFSSPRDPTTRTPADLPPSLLPRRPDTEYGYPRGDHACPNSRRREEFSNQGYCPLDIDDRRIAFDAYDGRFVMPPTARNPVRESHSYGFGNSCEYGVQDYPPSYRAAVPNVRSFGYETEGHRPNYWGH
jgi:hypothetical protein